MTNRKHLRGNYQNQGKDPNWPIQGWVRTGSRGFRQPQNSNIPKCERELSKSSLPQYQRVGQLLDKGHVFIVRILTTKEGPAHLAISSTRAMALTVHVTNFIGTQKAYMLQIKPFQAPRTSFFLVLIVLIGAKASKQVFFKFFIGTSKQVGFRRTNTITNFVRKCNK